MQDTLITIMGNATEDPRLRRTVNGHVVASFRIASTPRRYDAASGEWVNRPTLYLTVTCWRALAHNVAQSVFRGHPVMVTGRLQMREYEKNEMKHTSYELEAVCVGHDLARGTAEFSRTERPGPTGTIAVDDDGVPADDSDHYVDVDTGEVFSGGPVEEAPVPALTVA